MAQVIITISDEVPGQALSIQMEFTPAVKTRGDPDMDHNPEYFTEHNPDTHLAAYLAWEAIDRFMGSTPTVHGITKPIEI